MPSAGEKFNAFPGGGHLRLVPMPQIHPSASVGPDVQLADDVEIGPWCILSGIVKLGAGVRLIANVHINGPATIDAGTVIYPFACLGYPGQDFKFKLGDRTAGVVVGKNCIIREHATIHAATNDHTPTRAGDRMFLMVNSHIGHDAQVGDNVTIVNNSCLGGHSSLGDGVTLSGSVVIHQFARAGRLAFISGLSGISDDLPPFCLGYGKNVMVGLNLVGMRRAGIPREHITLVRHAYREAFRSELTRAETLEVLHDIGSAGEGCPPVLEMAEFIAAGKRPLVKAARRAITEAEVY
jgi:UDP-N-acetylglucosamine acyltransferase